MKLTTVTHVSVDGRWTSEVFRGYWGLMADSAQPITAALNTRPKYVALTTLTDPRWA